MLSTDDPPRDWDRDFGVMGEQLVRIEFALGELTKIAKRTDTTAQQTLIVAQQVAQKPAAAPTFTYKSQPAAAPRRPDQGKSAFCQCEHECWRRFADAVDAGGPPCACTDCKIDGDYGVRPCGCIDPSDARQQYTFTRQDGNRYRWLPTSAGAGGDLPFC